MENEGFWAWALGKKNNAMGLLRNGGKALVKQAFRDPAAGVTCWAKKIMPQRWPETQGKRCKTHSICMSRTIFRRTGGTSCSEPAGAMGLLRNLGNRWENE